MFLDPTEPARASSENIKTVEELDEEIHAIVRDIDHLYDRVSHLKNQRREPVRSLLAAAGMILAQERKLISSHNTDDNNEIDPTTIQLIVIALHELALELKK